MLVGVVRADGLGFGVVGCMEKGVVWGIGVS